MTTLNKALKKIPQIEFYNNLFNVESDEVNINDYLGHCYQCRSTPSIEAFIRNIIKNHNDYKDMLNDESNHNIYCRYFMYWLYREKNLYITMNGSRETWNGCISCVWDRLEKNRDVSGKKCEFNNVIDSFAIVQIMKIIDDMCAINAQTTLMNDIESNREKCLEFNKISKDYLVEILSHLSSIPNSISWKEEYLKIGKSCSDGQIYKLFEEKFCPLDVSPKIPKEQTCYTQQTTIQHTCTAELCSNIHQICEQHCPSKPCTTVERVTQSDCTPQPCDDLENLCPTWCTKQPQYEIYAREEQLEKAPKIPHLQIPVTVLSSVVGTIFFFLFLYKFTPFRSWFLNRIGSKKTLKHKIKQDMEREFLGAPFHPPYGDDQNSRPRVGYSQN